MRAGPLAISFAAGGIVVGLLIGLAIKKGAGGPVPGQVTRSMLIVLHPKGGSECEAVFPKVPGRVRRGDKFVWEVINTCGAQRTITISPKKEGDDAENVFDQRPPYAVSAPNDNANSPAQSGTLTIKTGAAYNHTYEYNVTVVGGNRYDPKLEVDP
jgi:hypothetical protein